MKSASLAAALVFVAASANAEVGMKKDWVYDTDKQFVATVNDQRDAYLVITKNAAEIHTPEPCDKDSWNGFKAPVKHLVNNRLVLGDLECPEGTYTVYYRGKKNHAKFTEELRWSTKVKMKNYTDEYLTTFSAMGFTAAYKELK